MSDSPKQSASSAAIRSPGPLESPILWFDLNAEIERLRGENACSARRIALPVVERYGIDQTSERGPGLSNNSTEASWSSC